MISFQEVPGDCFDRSREGVRKEKDRLRKIGADYLAYALIDALVDESFPVLEKLGERIEDREEAVLTNPEGMVLSLGRWWGIAVRERMRARP